MTDGTMLLTVDLTSGTAEEITYKGGDVLDIMNGGTGALEVAFDEDFENGTVTIPEGGCYNGLRTIGSIFCKSEGGGTISIVRR